MADLHSFGEALTPEGFAAKQATRQRTLDLLRQSDYWTHDRLNGDWVELCGRHDETLKMLLANDVLQPGWGRYIGINHGQDVLQANKERYKDATKAGLVEWVHGDWADVVSDLGAYPNARVVVFDGFNSPRHVNIKRIRRDSLDLAEHLYHRNGAVLLVMNFSLRGTTEAAADRHIEALLDWRETLCPGNHTEPSHEVYRSKVTNMLIAWLPLGF